MFVESGVHGGLDASALRETVSTASNLCGGVRDTIGIESVETLGLTLDGSSWLSRVVEAAMGRQLSDAFLSPSFARTGRREGLLSLLTSSHD